MEDCRRIVVVVGQGPSRFVNVCSLRPNYRKNFSKLQNRFDSLTETQDEDLAVERDSLKWQGKGVR